MNVKKYIDEINLRYEYHEDGYFVWKNPKKGGPRNGGRAVAGKRAGASGSSNGRESVRLLGERFFTYQLVYLLHHGYIPKFIDHIDGDHTNNRIENLREATKSQNSCNMKMHKDNRSGHKNIVAHQGGWRVRMMKDGVGYCGGTHKKLEDAVASAKELRERIHGEFARHV